MTKSLGSKHVWPHVVFLPSGLVCYGANAAVAVYSPTQEKIVQTLVQHSARFASP